MAAYDYIPNTLLNTVESIELLPVKGKVIQLLGTVIEASGLHLSVGELCILRNPGDTEELLAEVVGLSEKGTLLTPMGDIRGISTDTEIIPRPGASAVPVGDSLLGRALNALGEPLDTEAKGPLKVAEYYPIHATPPSPLVRAPIDSPLSLGVKAVDGLMTCGEGQRMGIFAAAGVGKSTLQAMMARHADVDVIVVVLIGERGREVREFIELQLGPQGMEKAVLVISTADQPAMLRVRAAYAGTAIAEYFRDQGKKVLLLMDSVTRFARSLREIGLSAGEPPTRRGYPSSVFALLPKLLERAGKGAIGSITGLYTVLVEGDDMSEPVADEVRSLLDGHIILSRDMAAANHYPAIDVLSSLSRVMNNIVSPEHMQLAGRVRSLLAKYKEIEFLVKVGEYQPGSDLEADEAIAKIDRINAFLQQEMSDKIPFDQVPQLMEQL